MRSWSAALAAGLVAATNAGCSSGPEEVATSGSATCASRAAATSEARNVSFARDVLPVFQSSCSFSSCHGTPGQNGIYLGAARGAAASAIRAALLETSPRASMPFVAPGEPDRSWLLRKLDGDFCGVTCNGGCGDRMPKGGVPVERPELDAIAAWIANGAPDN
ncbi:MAG: hypothetical protein KF795_23260 [Labilithrix sp.]|nr:hypothetical protein [Labilithrix sp.]